MSEPVRCLGCDENVAPGSRLFASRTAVPATGTLPGGFVCSACHQLARRGESAGPADTDRLSRIRDYGLGMAGGRIGANPG